MACLQKAACRETLADAEDRIALELALAESLIQDVPPAASTDAPDPHVSSMSCAAQAPAAQTRT